MELEIRGENLCILIKHSILSFIYEMAENQIFLRNIVACCFPKCNGYFKRKKHDDEAETEMKRCGNIFVIICKNFLDYSISRVYNVSKKTMLLMGLLFPFPRAA